VARPDPRSRGARLAGAAALAALALLAGCGEPGAPLTVYTAERIFTMDPGRPEATAVPLEALREIPVWGTVFEGRPFPIRD
jgi:hypothetical protein